MSAGGVVSGGGQSVRPSSAKFAEACVFLFSLFCLRELLLIVIPLRISSAVFEILGPLARYFISLCLRTLIVMFHNKLACILSLFATKYDFFLSFVVSEGILY